MQRHAPDFATTADWDAMYVDGEWRDGDGSDTIEIEDPSTRERFTTVPAGTEENVNAAYEAAAEAQADWSDRSPAERRDVVEEALELLDGEHADDMTELLVAESASTNVKAEGELRIAKAAMENAADLATDATGQHAPSNVAGKENVVKREPKGVVGVISPWNYPVHLSMRAVAPAIALGNAVVLKPASSTSVTGGLALARLFEKAGLPDGVFNVVTGHGSDVGDRMAGHPEADVVAFTGSTGVGKRVAAQAAENLATPAMELGGNNPHVVLEDADLDDAVDAGVFGTFVHQGQVCISINRHIVHKDVYDEYVDKLTERAEELPAGSAHDEDTVVGPIIDEDQRDQMLDYVESTLDAGATLETGGDTVDLDAVEDSLVVEPTVVSDATNEMAASCNEHFGPIAPVIPFSNDEEAVEIANDTQYGLSASIHSGALERAENLADRIESGMVHINDQPMNTEPELVPFGGTKDSGIGRYNADAVLHELTEQKWISIQHESREFPF